MGRKCFVESCLSDSNRLEDSGVTFHKVPSHADVRLKWMSLCRIPEDKKNSRIIYVCSRHFLRVDFCNFRGKKYMLRQGVFPSVFPWDKSKLEAIKVSSKDPEPAPVKKEPTDVTPPQPEVAPEEKTDADGESINTEIEAEEKSEIKEEIETEVVKEKPLETPPASEPLAAAVPAPSGETPTTSTPIKSEGDQAKSKPPNSGGSIDFAINSRLEALDFNNTWYPARIVEKDYEENEVLIHFEKYSSKYDEWINMDSPRLRPISLGQTSNTPATTAPAEAPPAVASTSTATTQFTVGERVFANWSDARKFPATVTQILPNDFYQVLFDDGFTKTQKSHLLCKYQGGQTKASPLFDPVQSTKQERREKKRKINIAALFGKRQKLDISEDKEKTPKTSSPSTPQRGPSPGDPVYEPWFPEWLNGRPVGADSFIDSVDGPRPSVVVPDPRLPPGWAKHLSQRINGASAGKWDTVIVSPENRRFRSKNDVRSYLEEHKSLKYNWSMFDFSLHRNRVRRQDRSSPAPPPRQPPPEVPEVASPSAPIEEADDPNRLKIPVVDGGYQCPIEGCGKVFRRETLAQMHVKYYHPEYTKFLDSTPNVADLAYARTVGESLDKSPTHVKSATPKASSRSYGSRAPSTKVVAPLAPPPSQVDELDANKPTSPATLLRNSKDSEIIKLLNTKPFDTKKEVDIKPLPSGLPSSMYPDIKLRDLLSKSEGIPKRDDMNLKTLSTTRPPAGIKTLLPVVRPETKSVGVKRKRGAPPHLESFETAGALSHAKGNQLINEPLLDSTIQTDTVTTTPPAPQPEVPPNNTIIEGGQVIKIVRMKQEEIINCTCGFPEEDGLMIQCDLCLCWQHAFCNSIERESQVPENYICKICQNPLRQRLSRKYFHDQEWLKQGVLPSTSFHSKDEESMGKRFEKLKKSHDISGGLIELKDYLGTLKIKLKIAEAKNHPKLYLWSKPWLNDNKVDVKKEEPSESMLMMILKGGKEDEENVIKAPTIPQPEAAIDSEDCRLNLLEHLSQVQSSVDERLDEFEKQIDALEDDSFYEDDPNYPKTRQTLNMLIKDMDTLHEFSQIPTLCMPSNNNISM